MFFCTIVNGLGATPKMISPLDFGLTKTMTGIENYEILLKCHQFAIDNGLGINYHGIDTLNLEIPHNAISIPLPLYTDFDGIVINVINHTKDIFLFEYNSTIDKIDITWNDVVKRHLPKESKEYVILLKDNEPWVHKRIGYDEIHYRQDFLYVKSGKPQNDVIASYETPMTRPRFEMFRINNSQPKIFKNLVFNRLKENTYKTFLISINNQFRVKLDNITINTPESNFYGDMAISITNSGGVEISNTIINGTYSQNKIFGYGIYMNNVWNMSVINLKADAKWGIFGTKNVNEIKLEGCDINRFDIHCYGKNVILSHCIIRNLYNQFSSIYGNVIFSGCIFDNSIPFLIESSYNAYTPFNLVWDDCVFRFGKKRNYLVTLFGVPGERNKRSELSRKCLPNIKIKNCCVELANDVDSWYVIWTGGVKWIEPFDYISKITIKNLEIVNGNNKSFSLFSENLKTSNQLITSVQYKKNKH